MNNTFTPVVLLGAARSGTKVLRDLVATHPHIDKVPFDINYIWRKGNEHVPHDEFPAALANPSSSLYIRKQLATYHRDGSYLIEKTVSNCVRVPYVRAVLPDAKFIHLVRNGYDVVESVFRQWEARPDLKYILSKMRQFPVFDAPGYAVSYAKDALGKILPGGRPAQSIWGVRYAGIREDLAARNLLEVCALQWTRCVEKSLEDLRDVPEDRVLTMPYEELVADPAKSLTSIGEFLDLDGEAFFDSARLGPVIQRGNVGKGLAALPDDGLISITEIMHKTLSRLGYSLPRQAEFMGMSGRDRATKLAG